MRAMAILYIGPHRNPDFATDYHLSPILAPASLLAHFPPLLMQCGEKDPFVDDTVIFAGRVREAKRTRKAELDLLLAGKSARFGEGMRMTAADGSGLIDGSRSVTLKRERDQLAREGEEDWVQMVLFSDWSHGYLQMGSLMREARAVIDELGDWIDDAFDRYGGNGINETTGAGASAVDVGISKGARGTGRRRWTGTVGKQSEGTNSLASETEETDDGSVITFVARKRAPSPKLEGAVKTETDVGRTADGGSNGTTAQEEQRGPGEEVPGGKVVGRGGQTISETEMIRRRRLVDWHVFD